MKSFDELNELHTKYFEIMDISSEQKYERIELALLLDDVFLFLFTYLEAEMLLDNFDIDAAYDLAIRRYTDALEDYGINFEKYPDVQDYVIRMSKNLVDSTIDSKSEKTSINKISIDDRSANVSQNESNSIFNRMEYDDAISTGKKHKTWITEGDKQVRPTHREVDMFSIPINDPFIVGSSQLMFPKDDSLGASVSELANCRCSVVYS